MRRDCHQNRLEEEEQNRTHTHILLLLLERSDSERRRPSQQTILSETNTLPGPLPLLPWRQVLGGKWYSWHRRRPAYNATPTSTRSVCKRAKTIRPSSEPSQPLQFFPSRPRGITGPRSEDLASSVHTGSGMHVLRLPHEVWHVCGAVVIMMPASQGAHVNFSDCRHFYLLIVVYITQSLFTYTIIRRIVVVCLLCVFHAESARSRWRRDGYMRIRRVDTYREGACRR